MKDSIYESYGFGCHCRNCQFRVMNKHDESICRQGILVPQLINNRSFCSVGVPSYINIDRFNNNAKTIDDAIAAMRREVCVNGTELASARIVLNNDKVMFISIEKSDPASILFYGIDKCDAPEKLKFYMRDTHDPYDRINVSNLIEALSNEVKSISINCDGR